MRAKAVLRGYLAGLVTGTAVSGLLLGGLSVLSDLPGDAPPEATEVEVPAGSEFDQSREDDAVSLPKLQDTQTPDAVPQVNAPDPDDLSSLEGADTTSSGQPETGAPETGLNMPDSPEGESGVDVGSEQPVLPNPQAQAPEAPTGEDDLSISTEPAQPAMPEPETESAAFPEREDDGADDPAGESDAAPAEDGETAPEAQADASPETAPEAPASDMPAPEAQDGAELSEPQEAAEDTAPAAPEGDAPADMTAPEGEAGGEGVDTASEEGAAGTIGDLADGVTTNRLPTAIDDPEPEPAPAEAAETEAETAEGATPEDLPRLERYATAFENPENKPLMSIILIDDGTSPIGPAALADFPYPLSFAVDASDANAAETAAKYRAAGMEVLVMVDLPQNASASDAETSMSIYLEAVPEAVAVFEGTGTGLQSSREAAEQLAPILQDSGHGLVMFPNGLNTVQKLIARQGVPSATVFRDFDSNGQSASAVRRFLDQAAFRAGQEEGGVIMVGRLRPDTISALLLWGLQDRAASVALAPVSAVLTAE
ncbi:divergent polysaccharide deacteylase family protein [Roseovarius sp. THAF8]|uniref:divergent polysaccharide deacteylase family protein n=1 Tax=Roseovarius sp. THAF8 TaxID=2587846 RepID=UPI0020C7B795|nr:divergent polysaccharide deacteylase family protein [Roseovarius sp. THAF8]